MLRFYTDPVTFRNIAPPLPPLPRRAALARVLHFLPMPMEKWVSAMKLTMILLIPILPVVPYAMQSPPRVEFTIPSAETPESSRSSPTAPVDGSRRAPSPFTEREIRERSSRWEILKLETAGWSLLMSDRFAIRSDGPSDEIRAAAVYLEEFHALHRRRLGGDSSDLRFSVRMFRRERDFRIYAQCRGVPEAESFYDPSGAEVVVRLTEPADRDRLARSLMHEFSHQYLHRVFGLTRPIWFAEGLAEYFTHFSISPGGLVPGADAPSHRDRLRGALLDRRRIPLRRLLGMDREEFYAGDIHLAYAEAWSFVRWLASRREDVHADALGALARGAAVGDLVDLRTAEEEWRKSLESYP